MIKIALPNGKFVQVKEAAITPEEAKQYKDIQQTGAVLGWGAGGGVLGGMSAFKPRQPVRIGRVLSGAGKGALIGTMLGIAVAEIASRFGLGGQGRQALKEYKVREVAESAPKWMKGFPYKRVSGEVFKELERGE